MTHALDLIPADRGRGVVLDHGRVLHDGDPVEAADAQYLLGTGADQSGRRRCRRRSAATPPSRLLDPAGGGEKGHFRGGEAMAVEFDITAPPGSPRWRSAWPSPARPTSPCG